jgi:hypothetical protein
MNPPKLEIVETGLRRIHRLGPARRIGSIDGIGLDHRQQPG